MTLDETIQICEVRAKNNYDLAAAYHTDEGVYIKEETRFRERAEEQEQLAAWLKELKERRLKEENDGK